MNKADSIIRYLDAGWLVVMFRNEIGSYSAALAKRDDFLNIADNDEKFTFDFDEKRITDDFTPTKVLERLAEKPLGNIVDNYEDKDNE